MCVSGLKIVKNGAGIKQQDENEVGELFEKLVYGAYIGDPNINNKKAKDYLNDAKRIIDKIGIFDKRVPQPKTPNTPKKPEGDRKKAPNEDDRTLRFPKKR